jgi:hypothetical protein
MTQTVGGTELPVETGSLFGTKQPARCLLRDTGSEGAASEGVP